MAHSDEFIFVGDGDGDGTTAGMLHLDTNVVSQLVSLAAKGFNPSNDGHVRAANLLRRTRTTHENYASTLATIEFSGFHSGELSIMNVQDALLLPAALWTLEPHALETFLLSGVPLTGTVDRHAADEQVRLVLADTQSGLPTLLAPYYLLSMTFHDHSRGPKASQWELGIDRALRILDDLDFVPPGALAIVGLFYCGVSTTRNLMQDAVFKVRRHGTRSAVHSGAWDLAFLGLPSYATLSQPGLRMQLVTSDKAFGRIASLIQSAPPLGSVVDLSSFDPARAEKWLQMIADFTEHRASATPTPPTREIVSRLAHPLESSLSIEPMTFDVVPSPTLPVVDATVVAECLELSGLDSPSLLERMPHVEVTPEHLLVACALITRGLEEDAATNGDDLDTATARLLSAHPALVAGTTRGMELLKAWLSGTEHNATAIIQDIFARQSPAIALLVLVRMLGTVLDGTDPAQTAGGEGGHGRP